MRLVPALILAAISAPALAQDEGGIPAPGGFDLAGEATLLSDYRFRGVSRSDEDPAVRGALNLYHDSGLYAGVRGTTLKGLDSFRLRDPAFGDLGDVQLDLYAGYGARLGGGFDLDAGLLYYVFAGGDGATDYVEPYASISYLIGPVNAAAGVKYAPAQEAIGDADMLYVFGQVDVTVPFSPWSFSGTLGHQDWGGYGAYRSWSLGGRYRLGPAELGLDYVDTDLPSAGGQDATLVGSVSFRF